MDQVTQQNAAMVEETTAASHALAQEATRLAARMSELRIEGGASAQRRAA
jgi:methyl-accepting chemotaxis protein